MAGIGAEPSNSTMAEFTRRSLPTERVRRLRAVPRRRPSLGRIQALKDRAYSLFQASHATRQDREDPPDQLRGLIQQPPKMGAIHDEQERAQRRMAALRPRLSVYGRQSSGRRQRNSNTYTG